MGTGTITLIILITIVIFVTFYGVSIYNQLIALRNRFKNAFSQIDVQLQRRYDLIPNLIETAKQYMKYEQETFTRVIEARNGAKTAAQNVSQNPADHETMQKLITAETMLNQSMTRFFALAENYPDLKANTTMQQLMEELTTTENKVSFARQAYNDAVMLYNTFKSQFPNSIFANLFHFQDATFFEIKEESFKEPIKVSFG